MLLQWAFKCTPIEISSENHGQTVLARQVFSGTFDLLSLPETNETAFACLKNFSIVTKVSSISEPGKSLSLLFRIAQGQQFSDFSFILMDACQVSLHFHF